MKNETIVGQKGIKRKLILLLLVVLAIVVIGIFSRSNKQTGSTATITSQKNQFTLQTKVAKADQPNFSKLLTNLNLAADSAILNFELESSSSAKLAFASPVNIKFKPQEKSLSFTGTLERNVGPADIALSQIKIPKESTFAIAAPDLFEITKKLNLAPNVWEWIDENKGPVQYLFFTDDQFAIATKNDKATLETLPDFKQDQVDNTTFYIGTPITAFNIGPTIFIASSKQTAETLLSVQKGKQDSVDFPRESTNATWHFSYSSHDQIPATVLEFIFGSESPPQFVNKIKTAIFTLSSSGFSGIIDLK